MKYRTVKATTSKSLDEVVQKYLNEGWQLQGGPYSVAKSEVRTVNVGRFVPSERDYRSFSFRNDFYCQALIKYEESDKK